MNSKPTPSESKHMALAKTLPCSVCNAPGPSQAHHPDQSDNWTVIALCWDCHQSGIGWHGDKSLWRIYKMNELKALGVTIRRLMLLNSSANGMAITNHQARKTA